MPNKYKEKDCLHCGTKFRKQGVYCSIACSNKARTVTQETKDKIKAKTREYYSSPEGIATANKNSKQMTEYNQKGYMPFNGISVDDFAVPIPDIKDLSDYDMDGYDLAEKW